MILAPIYIAQWFVVSRIAYPSTSDNGYFYFGEGNIWNANLQHLHRNQPNFLGEK